MKKKLLSLALALALCLGLGVPAGAAGATVADPHGLTVYYTGEKTAETQLTRLNAAQLMAKLAGLDLTSQEDPGYSDCGSLPAQDKNIVAAVSNAYIMTGDADSQFLPGRTLTRAEMAVVVTHAVTTKAYIYGSLSPQAPYTDAPENTWYAPYVNGLYEAGILPQAADGMFRPNDNITLGEAMEWLDGAYTCMSSPAAITFDANGGTGEMEGENLARNTSFLLPECEFEAPSGRPFQAWSVGGKEYQPNSAYKVTGDTTVLALWTGDTSGAVQPPKASPAGGSYTGSVQVTLTADGNIYYTTNGETPSLTAANGTQTYTGPITLTATTTLKAVSFSGGQMSEVAVYQYTIGASSSSGSDSSGDSSDSSDSSGSSGSASTSNTTSTTQRNPDGSTTTTVTDRKTGEVTRTTTVTQPDGTSAKVTQAAGEPTRAEVTFSASAVRTASANGQPVQAPVTVDKNNAVVELSGIDRAVKAAIPVKGIDNGTVAVINGTIVKNAAVVGGSLVVPVDGAVTVTIMDNTKEFSDMPNSHWANGAVTFVTSRELFSGTGAAAFSPDSAMTRQMLATVLARLDNDQTPYERIMEWAKEKGISDGTNPTGNISREQLAVMLYRFAGSPDSNSSLDARFQDSASVSGYANTAMSWAVEHGILSGKPGGVLDPQGQATRAQVSVMLQQYITKVGA